MKILRSKFEKIVIFQLFLAFEGPAREARRPWKPFRAPAHEARRSSRAQHKSPSTAEAHDSEQKVPDMQHKAPSRVNNSIAPTTVSAD